MPELSAVLDNHRLWLSGERGVRANLRGADLGEADLRGTDLWEAIDAPIQMQVESWLVHIQGGCLQIGCRYYSVEQWRQFSDEEIERMDEKAMAFWQRHKDWLLACCDAQIAVTKRETP